MIKKVILEYEVREPFDERCVACIRNDRVHIYRQHKEDQEWHIWPEEGISFPMTAVPLLVSLLVFEVEEEGTKSNSKKPK